MVYLRIRKVLLLFYLLSAASMMSVLLAQAPAVNTLSSTFCGFVVGVRSIVGSVALALFLMGGVGYAIGHFLPTSLDYRKVILGWSTAMIVGGLVGLVVVILAQPIVQLFVNIGQNLGGTTANVLC